jgi:hypothetical protein
MQMLIHGSTNMSELLFARSVLSAGARPNDHDAWYRSPMINATQGGCISIVEDLLQLGISPLDEDAVAEAAANGYLVIVNRFIKAGVIGEHLNLALAKATRYGPICVVDRLLVEGVDINVTKQGDNEKAVAGSRNLLQGAVQSGSLDIV